MLEGLTCTCEACDSRLSPAQRRLTMRTDAGVRRAYECDCGAVTVTVVRD
ncbi:MAG: hypothetical protein ABEJ04_04375 [Halobacteriaceae archaeon]